MPEFIITYEAALRGGIFVAVLAAMLLLEWALPRTVRALPSRRRRVSNFALVVIDTVFVRLLFPVAAAGMALIAAQNGWGLLNAVAVPPGAAFFIALIVLDMMIYWQHVASHKFSWLWALHKVHHADRDIDVTTGFRFHPVEIALSMAFKMAVIIALGAPVAAVIVFEIILNGCAMFNHSNIRLTPKLDRILRKFIVTPDMHRVHHSVIDREAGSNYGFSISIWDRLFRSYIAQPKHGHDGMTIGLKDHQTDAPAGLLWSLLLPFSARR